MPWILAEVIVPLHKHTEGEMQCWMGKIIDGDDVLIVRRLEPVRPGSLMYTVTDKETHVFKPGVRFKPSLKPVETRSSSRHMARQTAKRYTLKADEKLSLVIDELCVVGGL